MGKTFYSHCISPITHGSVNTREIHSEAPRTPAFLQWVDTHSWAQMNQREGWMPRGFFLTNIHVPVNINNWVVAPSNSAPTRRWDLMKRMEKVGGKESWIKPQSPDWINKFSSGLHCSSLYFLRFYNTLCKTNCEVQNKRFLYDNHQNSTKLHNFIFNEKL